MISFISVIVVHILSSFCASFSLVIIHYVIVVIVHYVCLFHVCRNHDNIQLTAYCVANNYLVVADDHLNPIIDRSNACGLV